MSTVQKINWEPLSDVITLARRDYTLADRTLADPSNAVCLVDGEWMKFDTSTGKLIRASTIGSVGNEATGGMLFPWWMERGRTDVQATGKGTVLLFGSWEAETRIYNAAVVVGSGAAITIPGQGLKVATITLGSRNYTGLVGHGGSADASPIVGYVSKLPSGGKLTLVSGYRR
jgi:hypothetical protein